LWGLGPRLRETGNESSSQCYAMWNTNIRETLKKDEKPRIKTMTETISTCQEKATIIINSPFRVHVIIQ